MAKKHLYDERGRHEGSIEDDGPFVKFLKMVGTFVLLGALLAMCSEANGEEPQERIPFETGRPK